MFRKDLIQLLLNNPLTVNQIARMMEVAPSEVVSDIEHLRKSFKHQEYALKVAPAECRKCDFEFGPDKLRKPSKCPKCRSNWLTEPVIFVEEIAAK